jgi:hypothetical protein
MPPIRIVPPVTGIIFALAVLTSPAWAASAFKPLTLSKECSKFSGKIPSYCTITNSNLGAIPVGTKVFYYGPVINDDAFLSSTVVLDAGNGNTAIGFCSVDSGSKPVLGMCSFSSGSGSLTGFEAIVKVTVDGNELWHWNGSYTLYPSQ